MHLERLNLIPSQEQETIRDLVRKYDGSNTFIKQIRDLPFFRNNTQFASLSNILQIVFRLCQNYPVLHKNVFWVVENGLDEIVPRNASLGTLLDINRDLNKIFLCNFSDENDAFRFEFKDMRDSGLIYLISTTAKVANGIIAHKDFESIQDKSLFFAQVLKNVDFFRSLMQFLSKDYIIPPEYFARGTAIREEFVRLITSMKRLAQYRYDEGYHDHLASLKLVENITLIFRLLDANKLFDGVSPQVVDSAQKSFKDLMTNAATICLSVPLNRKYFNSRWAKNIFESFDSLIRSNIGMFLPPQKLLARLIEFAASQFSSDKYTMTDLIMFHNLTIKLRDYYGQDLTPELKHSFGSLFAAFSTHAEFSKPLHYHAIYVVMLNSWRDFLLSADEQTFREFYPHALTFYKRSNVSVNHVSVNGSKDLYYMQLNKSIYFFTKLYANHKIDYNTQYQIVFDQCSNAGIIIANGVNLTIDFTHLDACVVGPLLNMVLKRCNPCYTHLTLIFDEANVSNPSDVKKDPILNRHVQMSATKDAVFDVLELTNADSYRATYNLNWAQTSLIKNEMVISRDRNTFREIDDLNRKIRAGDFEPRDPSQMQRGLTNSPVFLPSGSDQFVRNRDRRELPDYQNASVRYRDRG